MYEDSGKLYIIGTPIGNMGDITQRAIIVLGSVDFVYCEDTRVTGSMLKRLEIDNRCNRLDQHSSEDTVNKIVEILREGRNVAYVSDAGTPGVSDPGGRLVERVHQSLPGEHRVVPIPGPSALASIMSVSGLVKGDVLFIGFLPTKKGRMQKLLKIKEGEYNFILYESSHRILKLLGELAEYAPDREVVLGREMTKLFEDIRVGSAQELLDFTKMYPKTQKGEFTLMIKAKR